MISVDEIGGQTTDNRLWWVAPSTYVYLTRSTFQIVHAASCGNGK